MHKDCKVKVQSNLASSILGFILAAALFNLAGCDRSQEQNAPVAAGPSPVAPSPVLSRPTTRPGIIQSGDWLRIRVGELTSPSSITSFVTRVASDGTINLPLAGGVVVAGSTTVTAQQITAAAYSDAKVISRAPVLIDRILLKQSGDAAPGNIRKYDLLRVDVFDVIGPGICTTMIKRVASDGTFDTLLAGPVKVEGLNEKAATHAVIDRYRSEQIIQSATVFLTTLEAAPPNADQLDLPDSPIYPVPDPLKSYFMP